MPGLERFFVHGLGGAGLVVALAAGHPTAGLAAPSVPTQSALEDARRLFYRALALQDQGDYQRALELFESVAAVRESAQVRFNIAFSLERLGRSAEAVDSYERAIRLSAPAGAAHVTRAARERLRLLLPAVARVSLRVAPQGATLELDGRRIEAPSDSRPLTLAPGEHVLEVTAERFVRERIRLELAAGERRDLEVRLERAPEAASEPPPAPVAELRELEPVVVPEPVRSPPIVLPPPAVPRADRAPSAVPYVVAGAAALSLGASGVFYVLRKDALDTMKARCGAERERCPGELRSTDERGELYTTVANVALATGLGLAGTSAVLFVIDRRSIAGQRQGGLDVGLRASGSF